MSSATETARGLVTQQMIDQYHQEGFFILEGVLSPDDLELLRSGGQYSIDKLDRAMDAAGVDRVGINAMGKRYFSEGVYRDCPELRTFIFGPTMEEICRAVLGPDAYLF